MKDRLMWFKGSVVAASEAKVSALSPMAQFGLNVFEGIRAYRAASGDQLNVFRLREHLDRLAASCKMISIALPYDHAQIVGFIRDVVRANDYRDDIALRVTVFQDGEDSWMSTRPTDMFIAPIERRRKNPAALQGQRAIVSSWRRITDNSLSPRIKCGANYINARYAHLDAVSKGFDLPIFLGNDGKVSEGGGACVFIVRDGCLITPDLGSDILESITRDTILQLARSAGIPTLERRVDRTELLVADEIFLCGTAAEITPIVGVDNFVVADGQVGQITARLAHAYVEAVSGTHPIAGSWTTQI